MDNKSSTSDYSLYVGCRLTPEVRERFQTYVEKNGYFNAAEAVRDLIRRTIYS